MSGRHLDPSRSSVKRDLIRFVVLLAILAIVLIGGAKLITDVLQSGEETPLAQSTTTTTTRAPSTTTTSSTTSQATTTTASTGASTTTSTSQPTTTTTAAVALDPSEVSVLVLNSTSRTGLAARLVERLDALGYQTPEPTNYPNPLDQSRVWYVEGFALEAAAVAELVPDAIVEITPLETPRAAITVVLGASFTE